MHETFEVLPLFIHDSLITSLLITIYRPGSEAISTKFFEEFSDALERSSSYAKCIITGDVNLHLDVSAAPHATTFLALLDSFGLVEHVRLPTHSRGHQLDVVIARLDQQIVDIRVDPPGLLFDHSLIVAAFETTAQRPTRRRPRVQRRRWKDFNVEKFGEDLLQSSLIANPPSDVSCLFDCYNSTLASLVDHHAFNFNVTLY
jgi:hypothetical protein